MSAPPLVDPPAMPTMVSRLPKYSSRPKSATASSGVQTAPSAAAAGSRLTNGFYHHPGPAGVNGSSTTPPFSVAQNGFIRVPSSFSVKWSKENGVMENGETDGEGEWRGGKAGHVGQNRPGNSIPQYCSQQQQGSPVASQRDTKKTSGSSAGKANFGQSVIAPSSTSSSPQSSPSTLPVSKPSQTVSRLMNGTKHTLGVLPASKPRSGTSGSLRQPLSFAQSGGSRPGSGPGSRSCSPLQKKPPASRSHSSDSLGASASIQLTASDRFRSRSLTQVRQPPSPTLTLSSTSTSSSQTLTRSYSISRAAEKGLKEPTTSSAQTPPRGSFAKSPVSIQTPQVGGKGGGVKAQSYAASGRSGVTITSLLPPSALKKPLLPSLGPTSKPSGISYKLSRPSLIKQSRPVRVTQSSECGADPDVNRRLTEWRNSVETPCTIETSPESTPEAPEPVSQTEVSVVAETLEDMSLSSTSSLDRNDTSQEYMDDFDNLGNGGIGIRLLSSKSNEDDSGLDQSCARFDDDKVSVNGVTVANGGLCFLDDGMDWAGMRLAGERGALSRLSHRRRSSQPDYHDQGGSSLDLSPSDSCGSGGTYMWDEEGLEPLGGAATTASIITNSNTTHHIGSFDSDLNSIDILNNLDSCDLDDDDLMLDADLAEDTSLHSDGDGMSHMAQWRRRQLCWGMQDVHNDNGESDFQCYTLTEDPGNKRSDTSRDRDLILDLCPTRSPCLSPGAPGLALDVEELAEDCSAVRSQLEFLQKLLQQEEDVDDDTLTTDTVSPEESSHSCDSQLQALLQEVQQLREELRSRDQTIAQLTRQLTVPAMTTRCRCQEMAGRTDRHTQTSVAEKESVASQTPWREQHASQILHSSSQENQEPLKEQVPPPTQVPANPCCTQPVTPADRLPQCPHTNTTNPAPQAGEDDAKRQQKLEEKGRTKEKTGTCTRSLLLPQPSKLHLLLPQASRPSSSSGSATITAPPKKRVSRQLSNDTNSNGTSGVKLKSLAFTSTFSRLPKPKSH